MADLERILTPYYYEGKRYRPTIKELVGDINRQGGLLAEDPPPPRHAYHDRQPDILTTRSGMAKGNYMRCFVNPATANWSLPKRGAYVKTAGGGVHNAWFNRHRATYYDTFPLALEFRTGNIMPSTAHNVDLSDLDAAYRARDNPDLPPGLDNFYRFLALANARQLHDTGPNYVILIYHSRVFPTIWLEGFFEPNSINFTENADSANELRWNATLMVVKTAPKLGAYGTMRTMYIDYIRNSNTKEATPVRAAENIQKRGAAKERKDLMAFLDAQLAKVARTSGEESKLNRFRATKTGFEESPEDFGPLP